MAIFKNITRNEMAEQLEQQGFQLIGLSGTKELVWAKIFRKNSTVVSMRVYSSINPNGEAREVGTDAIRVMLFWKNQGEIVKVGSSKRVHRVEGWKKNLQNRIENWTRVLGPSCHSCNAPMILRTPKKSQKWTKFYGCATWPTTKCSGKAN